MKRTAVIISAEGVQDVELAYPMFRLQEAGYDVKLAALDCKEFKGIQGVQFKPDISLAMSHLWFPDLLILPGGVKAMEKLRMLTHVTDWIAAHHAQGGVIGCICSGAQLLIDAELVRGRKIAAYYAMRKDIENAGGEFVDGVVTCDRITTAPHYRNLGPWMAKVLEVSDLTNGQLSHNREPPVEVINGPLQTRNAARDIQDAKRWRRVVNMVAGQRIECTHLQHIPEYEFVLTRGETDENILQGSVAEHFAQHIDEIIAEEEKRTRK